MESKPSLIDQVDEVQEMESPQDLKGKREAPDSPKAAVAHFAPAPSEPGLDTKKQSDLYDDDFDTERVPEIEEQNAPAGQASPQFKDDKDGWDNFSELNNTDQIEGSQHSFRSGFSDLNQKDGGDLLSALQQAKKDEIKEIDEEEFEVDPFVGRS